MQPLVNAQIDAATGQYATVAVAELTSGGLTLRRVRDEQELNDLVTAGKGARIMLADPDMTISKYLTDQVVGKATEHLEVTGANGGPVVLAWQSS